MEQKLATETKSRLGTLQRFSSFHVICYSDFIQEGGEEKQRKMKKRKKKGFLMLLHICCLNVLALKVSLMSAGGWVQIPFKFFFFFFSFSFAFFFFISQQWVAILVRYLCIWPMSHHIGSHILTSGNGTGWKELGEKYRKMSQHKTKNNRRQKNKQGNGSRQEELGVKILRWQGRSWTWGAGPLRAPVKSYQWFELIFWWLPCQMPGFVRSGLVGPVSVHYDQVR